MVDPRLDLARRHHSAGDYAQAEHLCRQVLRDHPEELEAWRLLGEACLFQGKFAEAVDGYQQALRLGPNPAQVHNNLGVALSRLGKRDEAARSYLRAVQAAPDYAEARNNLAATLIDQGQPGEAETYLRQALDLKPDYAEAHNNLGIALAAQGRLGEAVTSYQRALHFRPDYANALRNLGITLLEQGRPDEAAASYQRALRLNWNSVEAHHGLGSALRQQGKLEEALASYRRALQINPKSAEAHNGLAVVLRQQGKLDEALSGFRRALELNPGHAEGHANLARALLLRGDFERGWREYEWRWKCKGFPRLPDHRPPWDGSPLQGRTILLLAEQGLGDTFQFIRYAPEVKRRGGTVVAACQRALLSLLASAPGLDALVDRDGPWPPFDVYAPLLSLPRILGTTPDTVPAAVPYLHPVADLVASWRDELRPLGDFLIGVAWRGSPSYREDRYRSFDLAQIEPLTRLPGVRLISLQKGVGAEQVGAWAGRVPVVDLGDRLDAAGPFLDTAAIMKGLDLVVTCDTAVAHLAGALAVPAWVALGFAADWRWMLGREDSPWYPTLRLFRQARPGDWAGVFARMAEALASRRGPSSG
jgi:Flp pilus assembly protein TadD